MHMPKSGQPERIAQIMANRNVQIVTAPYDSGNRDWRTGRGPAHILDHGLRDAFTQQGYKLTSTDLQVDSMAEIAVAFDLCRAISRHVKAASDSQAFPLLLTGNCGNALGTVSGLGIGKTGIVWFDAHGEFNTPETTLSGFLDGMGLAMITGRCWQAMAGTVPGFTPMPDNQIILVGARDLDPQERGMLENSGIVWVSSAQVRDQGIRNALRPHLERLRQRVEQVYVHLDLDALDPSEGQANQFPAPDGLTIAEVQQAIDAVKTQFRIAAAGLASYDPTCDTDQRVLDAVLNLLSAVVQSA
jgi:arginase